MKKLSIIMFLLLIVLAECQKNKDTDETTALAGRQM
jgi:hypothetical protein